MSDKISEEMLKFFDAVNGGTGPYGWIYAMEYDKYGIEHAKYRSCPGLESLILELERETVIIYYSSVSKKQKFTASFDSGYNFSHYTELSKIFDLLLVIPHLKNVH